jgi:hypothetical protein
MEKSVNKSVDMSTNPLHIEFTQQFEAQKMHSNNKYSATKFPPNGAIARLNHILIFQVVLLVLALVAIATHRGGWWMR